MKRINRFYVIPMMLSLMVAPLTYAGVKALTTETYSTEVYATGDGWTWISGGTPNSTSTVFPDLDIDDPTAYGVTIQYGDNGTSTTYEITGLPAGMLASQEGVLDNEYQNISVSNKDDLVLGDYTITVIAKPSGSASVSQDFTLKIKSSSLTISVTYDANGATSGTAPTDSNSPYAQGASATVLAGTGLTKDGYVFNGWNTQADGKGTNYAAGSTYTMGTSNATLYAIWLKEITITETTQEFTYDGATKAFAITGATDNLNDFTVTYSTGNPTDAGSYNVTITRAADSTYAAYNKTITGGLVINKATYNMTDASWNYYGEFHYDRTVQTIYVIDLPDGVTVDSYTNNSKTDPGNYTASVTFSYDTVNYNEPTIEDCNWTIIPTYQIVYNGNGSTEGIVPVDSEYEDKFYLNESEDFVLQGYYGELKNTGKTFVGWNTDSSATTALTTYIIDADDADASFNITLYAIWMDGTHTCDGTTYDVLLNSYTNGGTLTSGYYYLNDNLTLLSESSNLYIANANTVYICLNGYVLNLNGCCISNHGNLHICDCKNDNDHIHYFNPNADGVWEYDSTETESDYFCKGGVITGGYEAIRSETNSYEFITAELNIINVNFVGNTGNNGGAINTSSNTNVYNSNFFGNKTFTWGGALNANAEILIGGCVFKYNIAVMGGAIACENNVATIIDTVITDNIAIGDEESVGGGVYVRKDEASSCLIEGTQITMANGATKKIEDIVVGDKIKSFNHETGEFENNEVYITYKGESKSKYFTLNFASGTTLSICGMHDLLEKSAKKYVTITENNYKDYIGKYFYNANTRSWDKLVSVIKSNDKKEYYSIYVYKTFNAITNGMLTIADDNDCMLNIYEFNDDATADLIALQADIDKYGLLEFEDCVLVQSYEDYVKYNVKYYYIWLGKGLLTYKEICEYAKALYGNTNTPLMLMSVLVGDASTPTYSTYSDGVEASTLILVGDVTITGNKSGADEENLSEDNVYLTNDSYIKVISGATNIDIGVNLEGTTGIFIKAETNTDYLDFFSSDITPGYGIKIEETEEDSGEYNYLVFEKTTVTITEDAQQFTYDGNSKAFDIVDATDGLDDFTISYYVEGGWTTTAPTDFGSYNVKIYRAEDDNYKEYAENVITNGLVINQATTSITDLSITGWTYGDTANTPSATTNFGTIVYTYSDAENGTYTSTVPTNAGTYWVKASVVGNNNYTSDEEKTSFTISKATQTVVITNDISKIYDGTAVSAPTYTFNGDGVVTIEYKLSSAGDSAYTTTAPINANEFAYEYTVRVSIAEGTNYLSGSATANFTIRQKSVDVTFCEDNFTYNGENQKTSLIATYKNINDETVNLSITSMKLQGLPDIFAYREEFKYFGAYDVDFRFATKIEATNYAISGGLTTNSYVKTYNIKQKEVGLDWSAPESLVYDGTEKYGSVAVTGLCGTDECNVDLTTITLSGDNVNVTAEGFYFTVVGLSGEDSTNYKLPSNCDSEKLYITQKEVGIDWTNTTFTYDGNAHKPTATATNVVFGDTVEITVSGEQTNAGTGYVATATSLSNSNYELPTANTTTFVINKANYNMTNAGWSYTSAFTYDKTEKSVEVTGLPTGVTVASYANNAKTDAGNYTASVTFNYDTANYNEPTLEDCDWVIEKREIGIDWSNLSFAYNTLSHKPTATAINVVDGDTVELIVSGEQSAYGVHTATASFATEQQNYKLPTNVTAQFTINNEEYTVVFKNYDGTVLSTTNYYYGATPTAPEATREQTVDTVYEFVCWSPEVVSVTDDAEYIAVYSESPRLYTITFLNYDDSVLLTKNDYQYNDSIVVPEDPTRASNEEYDYEFVSWDRIVPQTVKKDLVLTAVFKRSFREYVVEFKNDDGSIIDSKSYHYNDILDTIANPTKENDETYKYTFARWDKEVPYRVTENSVYTAIYSKQFIKVVGDDTDPTNVNANIVESEALVPEGIETNVTFVVKAISTSAIDEKIEIPEDKDIVKTYNAKFLKNDVEFTDYSGEVTVKFAIPEEYTGKKNVQIVIWDNETNTSVVKDVKVEGNYLVFTTNTLGDFAIIADNNDLTWLWILLGALGIIGVILIIGLLGKRSIIFVVDGLPIGREDYKLREIIELPEEAKGYKWFEDKAKTKPFDRYRMGMMGFTLYADGKKTEKKSENNAVQKAEEKIEESELKSENPKEVKVVAKATKTNTTIPTKKTTTKKTPVIRKAVKITKKDDKK